MPSPLGRRARGMRPDELAALIQQGRKVEAVKSDALKRLLDDAEADPRRMDVDPEELVPASEETLVVDPETGRILVESEELAPGVEDDYMVDPETGEFISENFELLEDDGLAPVPADMATPPRRMTREEIDAEIAEIDAMSPEQVRATAAGMTPEPRAGRTFTNSPPESPVEPELTGSYSGPQPIPERVETTGTTRGPSKVTYRGGNKNQPHGGRRVLDKERRPVDPETGEEYGVPTRVLSDMSPDESVQRRLEMKRDVSEGSPVTLDDQGNPRKASGSNRVSADSQQYRDVIPDNRVGAAIESVFSGDPERLTEFRVWYKTLDDATRQRVDDRMLADPVGAEALRVMQGQDIDPARRAAIESVRQLEGGDVGAAILAPGDPQYIVPDNLRKKGKNPEGVRDRLNYGESMNPESTLPEPGEDGRIRGASGVGSLRKQLARSQVKDGEYVKESKINDRQAELDNTSEHQSFAGMLQRTLDEMAGGKQGTKKNAPEQMDTDRGGGAGKKGSRIAPEAAMSGSMQDLWRRMQSGDPRSRSLSPAEAFETPEQFAEAALSLAEFNPSRVLNDADAFRALTDAARREFYTPGNVKPATEAPAVGNNTNPSRVMEANKGEKGGPKSSRTSEPEPKTEGTTRKTDEPVYMDLDATSKANEERAAELERVLANSDQWNNMGLEDPNARNLPPPQEILSFDPEAYPEAAKVLRREGYHLPPQAVEGVTPRWSRNKELKTNDGASTRFFIRDPIATEPGDVPSGRGAGEPVDVDEAISVEDLPDERAAPPTEGKPRMSEDGSSWPPPASGPVDDPGWMRDVLGNRIGGTIENYRPGNWTPEGARKATRRALTYGGLGSAVLAGKAMQPSDRTADPLREERQARQLEQYGKPVAEMTPEEKRHWREQLRLRREMAATGGE